MLNRRDLLKLGAFVPAVALGATGSAPDGGSSVDLIPQSLPGPSTTGPDSPRFPPFRDALRIGPIAKPISRNDTTDTYGLTAKTAEVQVLPGKKTVIWGYDGLFPGPTIVQRSRRRTVVVHKNALPINTVVRFHGAHTPPQFDGYPTDYILPGTTREYDYPLKQRGATLWFHDHTMDYTARNSYMGLVGLFTLTDSEQDALNLPKGEFDVPLLIQDRIFTQDNQFYFPGLEHDGLLGDTLMVNGTVQPYFRVARRKYRFRLLNGSASRAYLLALSNGQEFVQIATDLGLMKAPVTRRELLLANAERYEVIIDFSRVPLNSSITLKNLYGDETTTEVMRFDVVREAADTSSIPSRLSSLVIPTESQAVRTREFLFHRSHGQWLINDKAFEPHRSDANIKLGTREIWKFVNKSGGWFHPIHVHDVGFFVLDRNGVKRSDYEAGLKDTVFLGPNETVRVITQPFEDFTGQYAFHCHNMVHEDARMMGTFEVVT
ncbi:MAG: multicopper oxidase family protein [Myxococcaceae bacterium]